MGTTRKGNLGHTGYTESSHSHEREESHYVSREAVVYARALEGMCGIGRECRPRDVGEDKRK